MSALMPTPRIVNIQITGSSNPNRRFYRGPSMAGTFRPGDCLAIESTPFSAIRCGDVILFRHGANRELVHRVVGKARDGWITRGDNNPKPDGRAVGPDLYSGRVALRTRGIRTKRVAGGRSGSWRGRALHLRRWMLAAGRFLLSPPYRLLRKSGLAGRIWNPPLQVVHFQSPAGPFVKYLVRGRTAIILWKESGRYACRKPYDLVLARLLRGHLPLEVLDDENILDIPDRRP